VWGVFLLAGGLSGRLGGTRSGAALAAVGAALVVWGLVQG